VHSIEDKSINTKIFFAKKSEGQDEIPGIIKTDGKNYLKAACGDGWLEITDLQLSGKKRMKAEDFLRGFQQINEYTFK
jgi:methionyl-tRNA formyltransferase